MTIRRFDAVVVGGGPAGLSAALVLGRARQRVLLVDAGEPANAVADGVGGLLGHPADAPATALRTAGAVQLRELDGVTRHVGRVRDARRLRSGDGGFAVDVDGTPVLARTILLASGLRYEPPGLPGLEPMWGRSVFHCQFCDGWEARDRKLAVYGHGAAAVRRGLLLRAWSDDVLVAGQAELVAAGVRVRGASVVELVADDEDPSRLRGIHFADGTFERSDALFVFPRLRRHDALANLLGCAPRPDEPALLAVDGDGRTSTAGVYAAGDLAEPVRSVANAIGSGSRVGKAMTLDLLRPQRVAAAAPAPARSRQLALA